MSAGSRGDASVDAADPREWLEPGVHRVTEGVWRVPLPLPVDGLAAVNCYIFESDGDAVLVDPGWVGETSELLVTDALAALGVDGSRVRVVATHNHWDHYSAAVTLGDRFGWPIAMGEAERTTVEAYLAVEDDIRRGHGGYFPVQAERLREYGAGELAAEVDALPPRDYERGVRFRRPDRYLADGEAIRLGDRELVARWTPGHTHGHLMIEDPSRGAIVTGDHVLPRISPSVGIEFEPESMPLASYLASLSRTLEIPDAIMLPAHGNVTSAVHPRVRALLAHHDQRLELVRSLIVDGADTALAIARRVSWTRRETELDQLETFHRMAAVLEIVAHTQVLESTGAIVAARGPKGIVFRAA